MINPERSDVDVKKLFNWGKEFFITDSDNNIIFNCFIRLVGDSELNQARVKAIRRSSELRQRLLNKDSDEHVAYIQPKEYFEGKEEIINSLLILKSSEIMKKAKENVNVPLPKEPKTDASLEEQEKYQAEVDAYPTKYYEAIRRETEKVSSEEKDKLLQVEFDELYKRYRNQLINQICETEMVECFKDFCTYLGTYRDSKYTEKLFESIEDFLKLPPEIKDQLIENYDSLEILSEELKK